MHNAFSRREVTNADGVLSVRVRAQGWDGTDRTSLRLQLESTAEEEARTRKLQQIYDARTAAVAAGAAAAKAELVSGAESRGTMEVGADEEAAMVRTISPSKYRSSKSTSVVVVVFFVFSEMDIGFVEICRVCFT